MLLVSCNIWCNMSDKIFAAASVNLLRSLIFQGKGGSNTQTLLQITINSCPSKAMLVNKGTGRLAYLNQFHDPETNVNFFFLEHSHWNFVSWEKFHISLISQIKRGNSQRIRLHHTWLLHRNARIYVIIMFLYPLKLRVFNYSTHEAEYNYITFIHALKLKDVQLYCDHSIYKVHTHISNNLKAIHRFLSDNHPIWV